MVHARPLLTSIGPSTRRFLVLAVAAATTPDALGAQQLERLTVGVRRPAPSVVAALTLQEVPRATPTRHVVVGALIGGVAGVIIRRATSNCGEAALESLCWDAATVSGLTVGAAVGAVGGLVFWIVARTRTESP